MNILNWYTDLESEFSIIDVMLFVAGLATLTSAAFRMMSPPESVYTVLSVFLLMVIGGAFIVRSSCRFIQNHW